MKTMKSQKPLTRHEILAALRRHQYNLKQFKVKRIGLFGSYATGRQNRKSDLDFLVEFDEPTFNNFMGLIEYLQKLFGKKVDILTPEGVKSIRIEEVANNIERNVAYVKV